MRDLKYDAFEPGDLTLAQLKRLTPKDPDWRDAQFLVLNQQWTPQKGKKQVVIICGQSRVNGSGQRVYCVGYKTGEIAWFTEDALTELQLREYSVLPKLRR